MTADREGGKTMNDERPQADPVVDLDPDGMTDPAAPGTDEVVEGEVGSARLVPPWEQGDGSTVKGASPEPPEGTELAKHTPPDGRS
jgi:hypothetical protein